MEKVKVVKAVPGLLQEGDVLISPAIGCDFNLEETKTTGFSKNERYVSLDYETVSANIPEYFTFDLSDLENKCTDCEACTCGDSDEYNTIARTDTEITDRYVFFKEQFEDAYRGSEHEIVYQNLMWFIEWLYGHKELI